MLSDAIGFFGGRDDPWGSASSSPYWAAQRAAWTAPAEFLFWRVGWNLGMLEWSWWTWRTWNILPRACSRLLLIHNKDRKDSVDFWPGAMCLRIGDASFLKTLVSPTSYIRPDLEHLEFQPPRKMPPPCRSKRFSASVRSGFGVKMGWVGSVGRPTCGSSTFVPGRTMNYLFIRCWLLTSVSIVDEFTHFFP
jgi:hypothetical protein